MRGAAARSAVAVEAASGVAVQAVGRARVVVVQTAAAAAVVVVVAAGTEAAAAPWAAAADGARAAAAAMVDLAAGTRAAEVVALRPEGRAAARAAAMVAAARAAAWAATHCRGRPEAPQDGPKARQGRLRGMPWTGRWRSAAAYPSSHL